MSIVLVGMCDKCGREHAEVYADDAVVNAGGRLCLKCDMMMPLYRLNYVWTRAWEKQA